MGFYGFQGLGVEGFKNRDLGRKSLSFEAWGLGFYDGSGFGGFGCRASAGFIV